MKRVIWGFTVAALLGSTGLTAQEHGGGEQSLQPETRAEAQARAEHLFDNLDLNHDGKLDQADRAVRMGEMFDRIDTNHDGTISRAEFAAAQDHMMHPDHDGPDHGGPDHLGMDHPGMHGHDGPMGHWGYDRRELDGLIMLILHRADPGHTGAVTRTTFVGAALALFDQADTNHDAVLTPAEHQAFAQAMRRQMHEHGDEPHGGPGADMPPPRPPSH